MKSIIKELERTSELFKTITFNNRMRSSVSLEPIADYLGAEMASFRVLSNKHGLPASDELQSLGIPDSVHDAYKTRYSRWDPAKRLLKRSLSQPLMSHQSMRGKWSKEDASEASMHLFQLEFDKYQKDFLFPNNLYHHVGFCIEDATGRKLLYDFHRKKYSAAFDDLIQARAEHVALFIHSQMNSFNDLHDGFIKNQLSEREFEVASTVVLGLSNKKIAEELNISVRTVENHLRSIFSKLNVATRTQLIAKLCNTSALGISPH